MSNNRFDFLELANAERVDVQRAGEPSVDITADPVDASVGRRVDDEGRPLAQVFDTEVRGYRAFMEAAKADEPQIATVYGESDREPAFELRAVEVFGGRGIKAGRFNYPGGIAVDNEGVLFVADSYNHRVQRITPDGGVAIVGGRGSARTQFLSPQAVAVDGYDSFYIVEQGNHRVQKYLKNGALDLVIDRHGNLDGELDRPTGIAVTRSGEIYVADTGNCRVQRFDRVGNFVLSIGAQPGLGVLTAPQAVAVDKDEYVYVLDTFGHRVIKFDPMGRFAGQVGGSRFRRNPQDSKSRFVEPRAIATDPLGLIYVADTGDAMADGNPSRGRLQVVDASTGDQLLTIDRLGRNLGCLFRPGGLAVASASAITPVPGGQAPRGDIFVSDTMNHRILRFAWHLR